MHGAEHTHKVLRMDNEFWMAAVRTWAASCEPSIELQPCIPHEHHSTGDIERFNQTLENAVFKKMYGRPHLTVQYWAMTNEDYIMKTNFMGSVHESTQCPNKPRTCRDLDLILLSII